MARSSGDRVIAFMETFCRHSEGQLAGEQITLVSWQKRLLMELFELRKDGRRRYRQALIGMARKNGKSSIGSALALYLLLMDGEPGAEVYSCAGDREQARIVFGNAKRMIELDPDLSRALTLYRDAIEHKPSGSVYRVLSAEAYTKEGLSPSGVIFDELHVQPNDDLWHVMTQGSGARRQPLVVAITTAGTDVEGTICGKLYRHGRRVDSREVEDPTFFFRWWEPKKADCDWRDPRVWAEANPALGDFLHTEDLEQAVKQIPEHVFRRYRLNQWVNVATSWLPSGAWDACSEPGLALDPELPLHVGVDVGLKHDSSALVAAQKQEERTVVRAKVWENPYPPEHSLHDSWKLNMAEVEGELRRLRERFPAPAVEIDGEVKPGPGFYYDPAFFERSAQILEGDGLAMVEFPQTDSRMIPASQLLYQLVVEGKLAQNGDKALARHVGNVVADQKPRGWRISKPRGSRTKIDAAVACAVACQGAQRPPLPNTRSYLEEEGVCFL